MKATKYYSEPKKLQFTFEYKEDKYEVIQSGTTILILKNGARQMGLHMNHPFNTEEELRDFIIPCITGER